MCGVIVVDVGRSRSTNLGRDAYILIIALDIVITIRFSINCPTVICLPIVYYFLREATSETYAPLDMSASYILFLSLFALVLDSNLHDLNEINPDLRYFQQNYHGVFCAEIKVLGMERNFL